MTAVPRGIRRGALFVAVAAGSILVALWAQWPQAAADEDVAPSTDLGAGSDSTLSIVSQFPWIDREAVSQSELRADLLQILRSRPNLAETLEPASGDVKDRVARVQRIARRNGENDAERLLLSSFDVSPEVRTAVLQGVRSAPSDATLRRRVAEMSRTDSSDRVRGYASLLRTDWAAESPSPSNADGETPPPRRLPRTASTPLPDAASPESEILSDDAWEAAPASRRSAKSSPIGGGYLPGAEGTAQPTLLKPVKPFWDSTPNDAPARATLSPSGSTKVAAPLDPADVETTTMLPSPLAHERARRDAARAEELRKKKERAISGGIQQMSASYEVDEPDESAIIRLSDVPRFDRMAAEFEDDPDGTSDLLNRPLEPEFPDDEPPMIVPADMLFTQPFEPPLGFSGPSSVRPTERQTSGHFVPTPDRWRNGFTPWDRYDRGHPFNDDYPYVEGHWWDPYNLNVIKGDYPIYGQHTFLNVTASEVMINEFRKLPTATTPFESTARPNQEEFFGRPNQYFFTNFMTVKFDLFHGNAAFKPADWRVRITPVFNNNFLRVQELGVVNPDVRKGRKRARDDFALQEWFVERKLADLSPDYDFVSLRVGSQPFVSDFRGFIFADTNRAVRLFGTLNSNRDQFNLIAFDQQEKDTNSGLNTHGDRHQQVFIANYYRQDFIFPGYTQQASVHYNHDQPSFKFDLNDFLVRPDPAGVAQPHEVNVMYLGLAGDGHIGRYNISHAFYWAMGQDSLNPIAGREQDIDAKMAAVELSYDRDWVRFRASYFWSSGDTDVNDKYARGFDTIFDNANFAGGQFSFWQRQNIPLFGVNLVNRGSLIPDLRSSKIQGQSNFVNPGLQLVNVGMDFEVTPKMKVITNANHLWFDSTEILEQFTFQDHIRSEIGYDLSVGVEYRPFLNDNVVFTGGFSSLIPGRGFDDLYGIGDLLRPFGDQKIEAPTLYAAFLEMALVF